MAPKLTQKVMGSDNNVLQKNLVKWKKDQKELRPSFEELCPNEIVNIDITDLGFPPYPFW